MPRGKLREVGFGLEALSWPRSEQHEHLQFRIRLKMRRGGALGFSRASKVGLARLQGPSSRKLGFSRAWLRHAAARHASPGHWVIGVSQQERGGEGRRCCEPLEERHVTLQTAVQKPISLDNIDL